MDHQYFMKKALAEAAKGRFKTYRNPMVGAVIVQNNVIIGTGFHQGYGLPHAEVEAFHAVKCPQEIRHSTMYVTLEPCSHYGKQPPCCQKLVEMGVQEVYIAGLDPNPLVQGNGLHYLEEHGILVHVGLLEEEARELNQFYYTFHEEKRPFIQLKMAQSLDGKLALAPQTTTQLTGAKAMLDVQRERSNYQGILAGSQTVLTDNPALTVRSQALAYPPVRIILDRSGRVQDAARTIFTDASAETWLFTQQAPPPHLEELQHVTFFYSTSWSLEDIIAKLGQLGIQSLYVEGGGQIHDAFLAADLWDQQTIYIAPKLIGGQGLASFHSQRLPTETQAVSIVNIETLETDLKLTIERSQPLCSLD